MSYRLTYHFERHDPPLARDQIPADRGACDAMLVASVIFPKDGGLSVQIVSYDGRVDAGGGKIGGLSDDELFKIWSLLAHHLAESKELGEGRRMFAGTVFETIQGALRREPGGI